MSNIEEKSREQLEKIKDFLQTKAKTMANSGFDIADMVKKLRERKKHDNGTTSRK